MKRVAMVLGAVLTLSLAGFGQYSSTGRASRTVTDIDLESYRQKRLEGERDYKKNYERMGFPSPEELDRQRDADMVVRLQLSGQLRQARLELERMQLERERLQIDAERLDAERRAESEAANYSQPPYSGGYYGDYGYGYGYGYGGFGVPYGGYFPPYRVMPGYRGNRLRSVYGYPSYRVMPYGSISTGTVQFSAGSVFSGPRYYGGGGIIGFPGGKK